MQIFEKSKTVNASSDQVFALLSDVHNLPQYLPTVRHAEYEGGDRIRIQGQAPGAEYDDTGFFRVDQLNQRMAWGSDGESGYQGWLQVKQTGGKATEVTVHLSFEPQNKALQAMDRHGSDHEQAINEGLEKALQSIKNLCEGRGGKVEAAR